MFCTVLDNQGSVESEQRYLPTCRRQAGRERYAAGIDETDYGYTGQRDLQDMGLMDYNARFYSPTIRRLISADTLIPDPSSSQAFNRYSYVTGNPLVFVDPSGHDYELWHYDKYGELPNSKSYISHYGRMDYSYLKENKERYQRNEDLFVDYDVTFAVAYCEYILHEDPLTQFYSDDLSEAFILLDEFHDNVSNGEQVTFADLVKPVTLLFILTGGDESIENGTKGNSLPLEYHHFVTNKHSYYTPQLESITNSYDLSLDGDWNIRLMQHRGRHPHAYHDYVLEAVQGIHEVLGGGKSNQERFIQMFTDLVIDPVLEVPLMLRKIFWDS